MTLDDVDLAIKNIRDQNSLTEEQFWQAVRDQGMDPGQYKKDLRRQLVRFKVINERVRSRVNVTEEEVRREYDTQARESSSKLSFRVSHVLMPIGNDASATEVAAMREKISSVHRNTTADNFPQQIEKHGGGELGWLNQGDLDPNLEEELLTLQPGEVSEPIRSKAGFHIFLLHEREAGAETQSYEERKEAIFRELYDQALLRQERIFVGEMMRKASVQRLL